MPFALGLGGNVGPVETTLRQALDALQHHLGPLKVAPLYRTAPVLPDKVAEPPPPQPDYLNTAAVGATNLPPEAILALAQDLERRHGRHPGPRNAPRPLDVDLLLYGTEQSDRPELILPHPRMAQRRFVLEPLARIAGDWVVPGSGRENDGGDSAPAGDLTVRELLERCADDSRVEQVEGRWQP